MKLLLLSIGILSIFWLAYVLYFKRKTSIFFNRYYLIFAWIGSIIIPILGYYFAPIHIEELKLSNEVLAMLSENNKQPNLHENSSQSIDSLQLIVLLYFSIVVILVLKVVFSIIKLKLEMAHCTLYRYKHFYYYHTDRKIAPFSFFNTIVLNHNQMTENDLHCVLTHESIHIKQGHHYDLLLSELACILFWFFPICYLLKRNIKENLEYITDYKSVQILNKKMYQNALIRIVSPQYSIRMATQFNKQMLKNRILMMNKPNSKMSKWNLLFFPILLTIVTAISVKAQEKTETKIVVITNDKDVSKDNVQVEITKNGTKQKVHSDQIELVNTAEMEKEFLWKNDNDQITISKQNGEDLVKIHSIELQDSLATTKRYTIKTVDKDGNIKTKKLILETLENIPLNDTDSKKVLEKIALKDKNETSFSFNFDEIKNSKSYEIIIQSDNEKSTTKIINQLDNDKTKVYVNGKEITKEEMNKINASDLKTIKVYKGESIPKEYKDKAENGVILIETK